MNMFGRVAGHLGATTMSVLTADIFIQEFKTHLDSASCHIDSRSTEYYVILSSTMTWHGG